MDSDKLSSLAVEVGHGKNQDQSRFKDEPDFDENWDGTAKSIKALRDNPDVEFIDVSNEIPDVD